MENIVLWGVCWLLVALFAIIFTHRMFKNGARNRFYRGYFEEKQRLAGKDPETVRITTLGF